MALRGGLSLSAQKSLVVIEQSIERSSLVYLKKKKKKKN
jgi:hypothetical protein